MVLVAVRPGRIPEWIWPLAGAALVVLVGAESFGAAAQAVTGEWNVLVFILGLMLISAAAERSGLFTWIADVFLERAGGSRRRLFAYVFGAGALLTMVMSNDATAIVFTPVVYRAIAGRGIDALPFLYACTFVADTASFGLPFSNPANLLVVRHPSLVPFVVHLFVPMLLAVGLNLAMFSFIFRARLRGDYERGTPPQLTPPMRATMAAMAVVATAYVVALLFDIALGPVALAGAALVLAAARVDPRNALRDVGWSTFVLLAGMFVLLDAVVHQGAVNWALRELHQEAAYGRLATILSAAFGSALAANIFNNLPVAVISGAVSAHTAGSSLSYSLIAGVDLGPNLTTTGSLATILWLSIVRSRGVNVSPIEYLRLGLSIVPIVLVVTSLWLWMVR